MARVESLLAVRRTGFSLNDASPYSLAGRDNSPTGFDISECWESEVGCNFLDNELKLNDCETVLEKPLREISEDNCVLYNPRDLNVNNETNIIQLSQKTDGVEENAENRIQEFGLNTCASMAPITNILYKNDPLDISSSEFRNSDFKLQSLATSPSNRGSRFLNGESNLFDSLLEGNNGSPIMVKEVDNLSSLLDSYEIPPCSNDSQLLSGEYLLELKLNGSKTVLNKFSQDISEDNCVRYNPWDLNLDDETIQLTQKTDRVEKSPENHTQELEFDTSTSMAPNANTFYKSDPLDVSSSEFGDNDFKLQSLAASPSNSGSKFLNGELNLFDSLLEGKNGSSVMVKEVDNLSSLLDSCEISPCNVDSILLNHKSHLLDSISEEEMNGLLVCKSPVVAEGEIPLDFPDSSVALSSNLDSRPLNGELDVLDLLLSEDKNCFHVSSVVAKDIYTGFKDESGILSSSTMSLANLADSHFFNNEPIKNINGMDKCSVSNSKHNPNSFSFNSFEKIQRSEKSEADFNTEEFLSKSNYETTKDFVHIQQLKGNMARNEVLEDEIELDIDLNFCVRSPNTKDNYFAESSNSESKDSGFDETDLETIKSIIPSFQVSTSGEKQKIETSKNVLEKERPSLLSIAISCELNLKKSRKEKLKRVKELLKHSFLGAFSNFKFEDDSQIVESSRNNSVKNICSNEEDIADYSDDCEELKNHMVFLGQ